MKSTGKYSIYRIGVASILKRFFSSVVDTIILSSVSSIIIFFMMKPQLMEMFKKEIEQSGIEFNISSNGKVTTDDSRVVVDENSNSIKIQKNDRNSKFFEIFDKVRNTILSDSKVQMFIVFIDCIYYMSFFLSSRQATIGQQLFGLMTVKNNGEKINFNDALNRTCLYYLLKLTAFTIFFSKRQETIYDYLSKTQVIEIQ